MLVLELVSVTLVFRKLQGRLRVGTAASTITKIISARLDALEEYRRPGAKLEARKRAGKTKKLRSARSKGKAINIDLGHSGISDQ